MTAVPAPTFVVHREEWPDDDFDIPDGHAITAASDAESDKDDALDEDWDAEMNLGRTGGARVGLNSSPPRLFPKTKSGFIPFAAMTSAPTAPQPPVLASTPVLNDDDSPDDFDEDEGVSTIKLSAGPTFLPPPPRTPSPLKPAADSTTDDDDVESDFALPSDLSQLSLRALPLHHPTKAAPDWGDKDHTSSSTSSDAYSTLGLGPGASPSSFGTSPSQPETETEDDEDEGMLEGLVVPMGLFDTGKGGKELARLLELKKTIPITDERVKVVSPDGEDDFEIGLVIDDDMDLSPSRLMTTQQKKQTISTSRPKSVPPRSSQPGRPPSRLRTEVSQATLARPQTVQDSARARNTRSPTFVRPRPPSRTQTAIPSTSSKRSDPPPVSSSSSLYPRSHTSVGLRNQKSHGVLLPSTKPALTRKASLSTLLDKNVESSGSSVASTRKRGDMLESPLLPKSASHMTLGHAARYEGSTASSRAKMQANFQSSSRLYAPEYQVPPTRPSTPSSNPAALRLTMPTASSRLKSRPPISSIFSPTSAGPSSSAANISPPHVSGRTSISPLPRPPSGSGSDRPRSQAQSGPTAKMLRRPKRLRTYGDGTELDAIDDLPTDRDKERKFRVAPRTFASRTSLTRSPPKDQGTVGRRAGRESSSLSSQDTLKPFSGSGTLRQKPRAPDSPTRRRRAGTVTNLSRRKPTLIRNLGSANAPKVVGDMKWNPHTLRWEGNEQVLREFDAAVGTSTRPALITHLTGSSIGSPVNSFATGARIVGNMIFDPTRMCWISRLPPEEDEPDVFADMADDEDEEGDERGGTIRASAQLGAGGTAPQTPARLSIREETPSPGGSSRHSRAFSDTSEGGGYLDTPISIDALDEHLVEETRLAEQRHRAEMKGWVVPPPPRTNRIMSSMDGAPDRRFLFEIRAVATKNYEGR